MSHPLDVSESITERLAAATAAYRDAKETFEVHRDRWHELITEAVDAGMKPAQVGALVGVSSQRIGTIVARVYSHDQ